MPEGRTERAVEALAKSIDGAEHSGMIKRVMAVVQIGTHDRQHFPRRDGARSGCDHRSELAAKCRSDRDEDRDQQAAQIPAYHHCATLTVSDARAVV